MAPTSCVLRLFGDHPKAFLADSSPGPKSYDFNAVGLGNAINDPKAAHPKTSQAS